MFHGYQNLVGFFHLAILALPSSQPPQPPQVFSNGTHASAHNLDGRPRKMLAVLNLLWTLRFLHGRVLFVFFFFSFLFDLPFGIICQSENFKMRLCAMPSPSLAIRSDQMMRIMTIRELYFERITPRRPIHRMTCCLALFNIDSVSLPVVRLFKKA